MAGKNALVIGAGVAGLSVAQRLKEMGADVVLLESQDRLGGRLWTDRSLGSPFELGAGWIHGPQGNPISELADSIAATTFVTNDDSLIVYDGQGNQITESLIDQLDADFENLLEQIDELVDAQADIPLQAAIESANADALNDELLKWGLTAFAEFDTGGAIEDLSAFYFDEDESFGSADVILTEGYDAILDPLSEGLTTHLQNEVQRIEYGDPGVTVTTNQGAFSGDFAVITLPLGVLKQGKVAFSPELPNSRTPELFPELDRQSARGKYHQSGVKI